MKRITVEFGSGESRWTIIPAHVSEDGEFVGATNDSCNYMLARFVDENGDEQELYAEISVHNMYHKPEEYDESEFDECTYPLLKDTILEQAAALGIPVESLHFE